MKFGTNLIINVCDEKSAVEFRQQNGIIPKTLKCSSGHQMKLAFTGRIRWRYYFRNCLGSKPVRKGTWLQDSRLPLETVIHFIYKRTNVSLILRNGVKYVPTLSCRLEQLHEGDMCLEDN